MNEKEMKSMITATWNQSSVTYDTHSSHGLLSEAEKQEWLKLLGRITGEKPRDILDVGTGTGFLSLLLCELGHNCKGIDLSEGMLEKAKDKAKKRNLNIKFEIGDAEKIASPDSAYDIVINRHLLWTLPHPKEAINEWIRVTKDGGKVIIIDGDWFDNTFDLKARRKIASLVNFFKGKKNTGGRSYSNELVNELPLMREQSTQKALDIIRGTGCEFSLEDARNVECAERKSMDFSARINRQIHRKVIILNVDRKLFAETCA